MYLKYYLILLLGSLKPVLIIKLNLTEMGLRMPKNILTMF